MENKKEVSSAVTVIFFALNLLLIFTLFKIVFIDKELSNLSTGLVFLYLFLNFLFNFKYRKEEMAVLSTLNKIVVWIVTILGLALGIAFIIWRVKP